MILAAIIDCETTDLIPNRSLRDDKLAHIIQFYGCMVDLDSEAPPIVIKQSLFNPGVPIPDKIQRITRITDEMVKYAPKFLNKAVKVRDFLQSAPLIIAHNCSFDKEVLDIELERAGVPIKWPPCLCTVEASIHLHGKRLTLSALYEDLFKEKFKDAHRADVDVAALVRVVRELRRRGEI